MTLKWVKITEISMNKWRYRLLSCTSLKHLFFGNLYTLCGQGRTHISYLPQVRFTEITMLMLKSTSIILLQNNKVWTWLVNSSSRTHNFQLHISIINVTTATENGWKCQALCQILSCKVYENLLEKSHAYFIFLYLLLPSIERYYLP